MVGLLRLGARGAGVGHMVRLGARGSSSGYMVRLGALVQDIWLG